MYPRRVRLSEATSMHDPVAALNLSNRHEASILSAHLASERVTPAVVISGFLGSGKTTLVQHLLRNRGNLRIAVLVNEVGQADIDSQLLNLKQSNAAVGLAAADLSGGCICCSKQDELQEALETIRTSTRPDYLIFETSGVADPEALALLLGASGFRLEAVVTVIDVEAAADSLNRDIAQQQVRMADVIVLNKCDLATLGEVSDLEDRIHSMVPQVSSVVRARFGQVPLQLILDVDVGGSPGSLPSNPAGPDGSTIKSSGPSSTAGSDGFMSHEAPLGVPTPSYRVPAAQGAGDVRGSGRTRRLPRVEQQQQQQQQQLQQEGPSAAEAAACSSGAQAHVHDHRHQSNDNAAAPAHHQHAHLHQGFHTRSVVLTSCPLPLLGVQMFIAQQLLKAPGLLRAKGLVWVSERRSQRFVLHLSGRQRAECCSEGPWDSPPMTQLVFIGSDEHALDELVASLNGLSLLSPPAHAMPGGMLIVDADPAGIALAPALLPVAPGVQRSAGPGPALLLPRVPIAAPVAGLSAAAPSPWDPRLQLLSAQTCAAPGDGGAPTGSAGASGSVLLEFTVLSAQLQGVSGAEVNAAIMQAVNRAGPAAGAGAFLFGARAAGCISATTMMQRTDSVSSLMIALPMELGYKEAPPLGLASEESNGAPIPGAGVAGEEQENRVWREVDSAAGPLLRKAFRNVIHCSCDMGAC